MTFNAKWLSLAMAFSMAVPALAEIDLSGSWASINDEDSMERGAGPNPDDWAGIPFNDAGRAKALAFCRRWWKPMAWSNSAKRSRRLSRARASGFWAMPI